MRYEVKVTGTGGDRLRIRSGPGTSFDRVDALPEGATFYVNGKEGDWFKLENGQGYVSAQYVKVIKDLSGSTQTPAKNPPPQPSKPSSPPLNPTIPDQPAPTEEPFQFGGPNHYEPFAKKGQLGQSDIHKVGGGNTPSEKLPKSYYANYDFVKSNLKKIHMNHNLLDSPSDIAKIRKDMMTRFNRFKTVYPDVELTKGFSYVFFVRPDLNLFEGNKLRKEVENEPSFNILHKTNPHILKSLTSGFAADHDFLPLLSNRALSFEIQDEYIKTEEVGETFTGYKTRYAHNNVDSKTAGSFSVQFAEDHELNVYRTVKAWIDYASNAYRGEFSPAEEKTLIDKVIDYAGAVYYFLCAEDGETILFWSKYFGIIPTTAPSSNFSYSKGNFITTPEISINFDYSSKEDFNPITIYEFNLNSRGGLFYKRSYERNLVGSGISMAGAPFVETVSIGGEYDLRLKFRV